MQKMRSSGDIKEEKSNTSNHKSLKSRSVSNPLIVVDEDGNYDSHDKLPDDVTQGVRSKNIKPNEKEDKKKDYDSSTTVESSDIISKFEKSEEFMEKKNKLMKSRQEMARCWVMIVFSYFVLRASFIIYPQWEDYEPEIQAVIIVQTVMQIIVFCVTSLSFYSEKYLWVTKWIVYFQSLEMVLSNFDRYLDY